jgi:murein DD-endopeptidase MepM/ murein hydrolase activator NlpD
MSKIKNLIKKISFIPLIFLDMLGETAADVVCAAFRDLSEFALLTFKLIWEKSVKIRTIILNKMKYIFIFIASPFVKMLINIQNMRRDMKEQNQSKGTFAAILAFFSYFIKFVFGKRGLAVTAFNYTAPVLSIVFLFNVVSYATSANFSLALTVNGEFLGYIESEQVFLDAEASVLRRVNYFGSDQTIEVRPEFSIANSGSNEMLTFNQVANAVLESSDYSLTYAFGFFIDGICYGAVFSYCGNCDAPIHYCQCNPDDVQATNPLSDTIQSLLDRYSSASGDDEDEEVSFLNNVQWNDYELFLEESVVDPSEIISMITAAVDGQPYLPVTVTRTESYNVDVDYETQFQLSDNLFEGSTRESQQGALGVNHVTARVSYLNGDEIRRNVISTTPVSAPTPRIILRGTKPLEDRAVSNQPAQYGMFIWPVISGGQPAGRITQHFHGSHRAVDIAGSGLRGTPIVAGDSGTVITVERLWTGYGHYIVILHDNGFRTLYSHLDEIIVHVGQEVIQGEQIGTLGNTGRTQGAHLHFEVIATGGVRHNPVNYLPQR